METLKDWQIHFFRKEQCDTHLHCTACRMADDECFRLYGTDSISDQDVLWPRWLEMYNSVIQQVYPAKDMK